MPCRYLPNILTIICYSWSILALAQSPKIDAITIKDGLSQGMIFDIIKDKEGFLWFGTKNGLNRYDGYEFKVFTNNPFDTTSVSGDAITQLFEDSKGRFWVGTLNSGLNLFDKKTQTFHRVSSPEMKQKYNLDKLTVYHIIEDNKGRIWFTNKKELFRLEILETATNPAPHFKVEFITKAKNPNELNLGILWTSKQELLIHQMDEGIFIWEEASEQLKPYLLGGDYNAINCFVEAPAGILWLASVKENRLILHRIEHQKVVATYPLDAVLSRPTLNGIVKIVEHPDPQKVSVAYAFHAPIYEIDLTISPAVSKLKKSYEGEKGVYYPAMYFEDDRTLWLGTNGYGIRKMSLQSYPFRHLAAGSSVRYMHQPQGKELFFTALNELYLTPANNEEQISGYQYFNIQNPRIKLISIITDKKEGNWILAKDLDKAIPDSKQGFMYELNADLSIKKRYSSGPAASIFGHFLADEAGYFWFYRDQFPGKLVRFHPATNDYEIFECTDSSLLKKNQNSVLNNHMYLDQEETIWVATSQGLYHFNMDDAAKNCDCQLYKNNTNNTRSIRHNDVGGVLTDPTQPQKYMWVATKGGGLNRLDRETGQFDHYTTADGLPDNVVYGILSDEENNLWLSTNRGLSKFNPKTKVFTNFTAEDGLQDNEFNTASFYKDEKTGELFFGGINGITAFFPNEIKLKNYKPNLFFTNLKINNESIEVGKKLQQPGKNPLTQSIELTKKMELAWYQNQISLQFSALDFTVPEKNLYQYQLSSIDKDWVSADKTRTANYANLAPGNYTFQVRGSNSSGIWNDEELSLELIIHPPWWRTNLAYFIYIALLITSFWAIYQFQINRIKLQNQLTYEQKEAARLADLDKIKTNFFSNITHEFRTPLTLIIEPLRQILKNPNQSWLSKIELAKINSERLLHLINQLLDLSKLEQEKMHTELKRGDIETIVQPIADSFHALAKQKDILFHYDFDTDIEQFDFDKDKIEKVLFNLLSNAIKFTPSKGAVSFSVSKTASNHILLTISDTGAGISEDQQAKVFDRFYQIDASQTRVQQGTGIGLALTKELVEVMNGKIHLSSTLGKGSTFEVLIPMVFANNTEMLTSSTPVILEPKPHHLLENKPIAIPSMNPDASNIALLIEDNQELRQFIKMSLIDNYQVIEADNGKAGWQLAIEHLPNIIISDVMMPALDGFTLCQKLKTNEKTAHIPIILLTAKTALDSKLKGLKYGADSYMTKPFNIEELLVRMTNLLENRRRVQAQYSAFLETKLILQKNDTTPPPANSTQNNLSEYDQLFLEKIYKIIKAHLDHEQLNVAFLAREVAMSRVQLYRKTKALLNQTPSDLINTIRLQSAYSLLSQKKGNVTEIAFQVGFSSQKYFSTKFRERYGLSPRELLKS